MCAPKCSGCRLDCVHPSLTASESVAYHRSGLVLAERLEASGACHFSQRGQAIRLLSRVRRRRPTSLTRGCYGERRRPPHATRPTPCAARPASASSQRAVRRPIPRRCQVAILGARCPPPVSSSGIAPVWSAAGVVLPQPSPLLVTVIRGGGTRGADARSGPGIVVREAVAGVRL